MFCPHANNATVGIHLLAEMEHHSTSTTTTIPTQHIHKNNNEPRDGASTSFEADPNLYRIFWRSKQLTEQHRHNEENSNSNNKNNNNNKNKKEKQHSEDDTCRRPMECGPEFGIAVVTMWPPPKNNKDNGLMEGYARFISAVQCCFDDVDLKVCHKNNNNNNNIPSYSSCFFPLLPAVYFSPLEHLHITVATLHSFQKTTSTSTTTTAAAGNLPSHEQQCQLASRWKELIRSASQRSSWPKKKQASKQKKSLLRFRIQKAQIGKKAGILIWEELTGNLDAMRDCIRLQIHDEQYQHQQQHKNNNNNNHDDDDNINTMFFQNNDYFIPSIVHTTFLRFASIPKTNGTIVQERFQSVITMDALQSWFPHVIEVNEVRLIWERTAFMHIPADDNHILDVYTL